MYSLVINDFKMIIILAGKYNKHKKDCLEKQHIRKIGVSVLLILYKQSATLLTVVLVELSFKKIVFF